MKKKPTYEELEQELNTLKNENTKILNSAFINNPNPSILVNSNFEIVIINSSLLKLKNLSYDNVIGKKCYDVYHNKTEICENCYLKKVFAENKNFNYEHKEELTNGEIEYYKTFAYPVLNKNNKVLYAAETTYNITAQKIAQHKLINSHRESIIREDMLNKMIEHLPSGIAIYKPINNGNDFEFINVNKRAEIITNTTKAKLVGKTLLEKFPNMGEKPLFKALQEINEIGKDIYLPPFYYKDEEREGWRENYIYKLNSGEIVAIFTDVTEIKNSEQELIEKNSELSKTIEIANINKEKFALLFEESPVSLWEQDYTDIKLMLDNKIKEGVNLEEFLDKNSDFVLECASKIKTLNVNLKTLDLIGANTKEELINNLSKNFNDKSFETFKKVLLSIENNEKTFTTETEYLKNDGKTLNVIFQLINLSNKNKALLSMTDITHLKQIDKKLQQQNNEYYALNEEYLNQNEKIKAINEDLIKSHNELKIAKEKAEENYKKYKLLYTNTLDIIWTADLNFNLIYINEAIYKIFGYTVEEATGMNASVLTTKEGFKKIKEIAKNALKEYNKSNKLKQYKIELQQIKKDASLIDVELITNILTNKEGKAIGFQGRTIDITERKKAEKELKKLSKAVEQSANTIVITDPEGNIEYVNPKFTKLTGYTENEVIGQNPRILNAGTLPKEYYKELWDTITKGENWAGQLHNKKKNGKFFWEQVTITPIFEDKKIINYLSIKEDITARKKAEKELIIAKEKAEESNKLKTEFINNMSHEIRTPMNGILGFTKVLETPNLTSEKRSQYINIIQNSGYQLMRIIDDILEISRLETKQVELIEEEVCLNDLLFEQFLLFDIKAKENKIHLYYKKACEDNKATILTDKTKLNKILSNLLENAFKFTKVGYIEFGYKIKKNKIEIYVKDTGIGIKKKNQKTIFERFSQAEKKLSQKSGGLGLGLSIAKENTELLGGKITLKSEVDKGSTFYITIPYKPTKIELNNSLNNNKQGGYNLKNYTVLIAEDEEINFLFLETIIGLSEFDIKIIHAKNGKEAVEKCKSNPDIDLILMDLKMPVMNGFEAAKLIKQFCPNIPIIAQTAYSNFEDKEKATKAGCNYFISKPISEKDLNKILDKFLLNREDAHF